MRALISRCRFAAVPADDIERLGPVVPRSHASNSPVHRSSRPEDISALVAAEPRLQSGGQPLSRRRRWPTGSRGFRTTSISTDRRLSLCARTWATATDSKRGTRRRATPIARPWPRVKGRAYVVAAAPSVQHDPRFRPSSGPLELLHVEGRYAVYRVNPELLVQRQR